METEDGASLFGQAWQPTGKDGAVVCVVHGLGEHSGRYAQFARRLGEQGFTVCAFDQRGFGRSPGMRGYINSYAEMLADIDLFLRKTKTMFPNRKYFLYGHSMGGALVLNYALRRRPELAGVVSTGPWLRLVREPGLALMAILRMMNVIKPGLAQANGIDTSVLCRDPAIVAGYTEDPLVHDRISARLFVEASTAGRWALSNAQGWTLPLLLMHGGADQLTSVAASREFASGIKGDCTFRVWDGYYHELHNEPQNGEFYDFLVAWLNEHLK